MRILVYPEDNLINMMVTTEFKRWNVNILEAANGLIAGTTYCKPQYRFIAA